MRRGLWGVRVEDLRVEDLDTAPSTGCCAAAVPGSTAR